jgi:uncharacterized protein (TIGR01777 family)
MATRQTILITGGTGLIGHRLTVALQNKNYSISHLSRKKRLGSSVTTFFWDPEKNYLEPGALDRVDAIIHLAGAGIAEARWTEKRKKELIRSRTSGLILLENEISKNSHQPTTLISASGIAYYGASTANVHQTEKSGPGNDFLAEVTKQWEAAADTFLSRGMRVVKLRTGIVLSKTGGALEKMAAPARWGLGAALGDGQQWCSWIHLDDLCQLYINALEDTSWKGAYNAVAPHPVTNNVLTRLICQTLNKPLWLPNIPAFALKAALGELSTIVLGSSYIVNERIDQETAFRYQYPELAAALRDVL